VTVVLVHGVPETSAIWDGLRDRLDRESVALALPGFGTPRPDGFAATKDAYADWLADQLRAIGGPIDLVGHDWGALLTVRLATAYDLPLRSWVADVVNPFRDDYTWHAKAQRWQTPGAGEEYVAEWLALPAEHTDSIAGVLRGHGNPPAAAEAMSHELGTTTMQCILDLYRSGLPNLAAHWPLAGPTAAPGMLVVPAADPLNNEGRLRQVAPRLGADVAVLPGLRHAWMAQDPAAANAALSSFWARVT